MLHLVFRSPFTHAALADCLQQLTADDAVVLLEDAVTAALADGPWAAQLAACDAVVWVLDDDLVARGLGARCHPAIQRATWETLVELSTRHPTSHSWLS
ncbi:MAG TPA: sulfurtransferase complex subunit TusB [Spongiibacteraceae bacterium]|nr:sulfurtransferase complex subunit TusB [Spongiibacteraceae bacterium]